MKRSLSFDATGETALVVVGTALIAATYGLVRLSYGLFLPDIQASLALGDAAAGYLSSAASVSYCLGALIGLVGDRRPRALVLAATVTGTVGALGMALAPGVAPFAIGAVIGSAGAGLASPGLVGMVSRRVAEERRDRAQAVVNSGTGPGLVAAGMLALVLLPHWRAGFVVAAVVTGVVGGGVLAVGRGGRRAARRLSESSERAARSWRWAVALVWPAAGALLLGASSAAVWTYGRSQLVAEGAGATAATVAWIGIGVGGTATVLTARRLSRLPAAVAWVVTTVTVAASVGALALGAGVLAVGVLACLLFGWSFVAATSALIAWVGELLPDRAAAGTAVLFVTLTLGQAVGSALAGTVADVGSLALAFVVASSLALLAAGCGAGRRRGARASEAEPPSPVHR